MIIEQVKKKKPLDRLLYWISERESIRLKKEAGAAKPWTTDTILQSYRFCNVRRMDDKVSRWLYDNWYEPNRNHRNMLGACALARLINLPETLIEVGFPSVWRPEHVKQVMRRRMKDGLSVYNGAYMIRGGGNPDKAGAAVDWYVGPFMTNPPTIDRQSMEASWTNVHEMFGMGSFMAGQVCADYRWACDNNWKDVNTWAPMGPGSKRGMNRLHSRPIDAPMNQAKFLKELRQLIDICQNELPDSIASRLEAIDYQSTLCEYDKYERTIWGQSRPKQKYPGL